LPTLLYSAVKLQMKPNTKCYCKSEFPQVFNFVISCYSRNSRKLDAREKLLLYSTVIHTTEKCQPICGPPFCKWHHVRRHNSTLDQTIITTISLQGM